MRGGQFLLSVFLAIVFIITNKIAVMAKCEESEYKALASYGVIEIRQYVSRIAAQVILEGDRDQCLNEGFVILAGYIFGKNTRKQRIPVASPAVADSEVKIDESLYRSENIPMTKPVVAQSIIDNKWIIRFYMPSSYSLDTLPIPDNKSIQIVQIPSEKFAVIKFSGLGSNKTFAKKTALLKQFLAKEKIRISSSELCAFYNPPWTLPFLRRNEIMIPIFKDRYALYQTEISN